METGGGYRKSFSFNPNTCLHRDRRVYVTAPEQVHLADGLVLDYVIECPMHNGQFDYRSGEAKRAPVCENLGTYPAKVENGRVLVGIG